MNVITSDGFIEQFHRSKIVESLKRDLEFAKTIGATIEIDDDELYKIADSVKRLVSRLDEDLISSDTIRGLVVQQLIKRGNVELAKIVEVVGLRSRDIWSIEHGSGDWDNANLKPTPETSHKLKADEISKKFVQRILPEKIVKAHMSGDIHYHDAEYFTTRPFCRSWDIRPFLYYGFYPDGDSGAINAGPAKHAEVAILQACKILAMGQTQHSGGQGLLHGLVFLSPYMENKPYKEIKQLWQMFIYELNQMYVSRGGQVIFSSINISPGCPKILEDVRVVRGGQILDQTYKDFEREIRLGFKALMEISLEGDYSGKPFPFPKLEIAFEPKFVDDETWKNPLVIGDEVIPSYYELYKLAFKVTAKWGTPYFDNLLMEKKKADSSVSCTQCCAFQFASDSDVDKNFEKKLQFVDGHHFRLGGMQVVSINLPRVAYYADHDDKKFYTKLYDLMDLAVEIFKIKRQLIEQNKDRLRFLFQTPKKFGPNGLEVGQPFIDLDELVYEVGIVGLNECVQHHIGYQLNESEEAVKKGEEILGRMNEYCKMLSTMHNMKIVLSRTPAETTAQKFAVCDLLDSRFREFAKQTVKGDLRTALSKINKTRNLPVYYSNGFAPPVDTFLYDRLYIESTLWKYTDGGAITHIWLGEEESDPESLMKLTIDLFRRSNIGYMAYTLDFTYCNTCGSVSTGIKEDCPKCNGQELTYYSRITGYYSVIGEKHGETFRARWNAAKVRELFDRSKYTMNHEGK